VCAHRIKSKNFLAQSFPPPNKNITFPGKNQRFSKALLNFSDFAKGAAKIYLNLMARRTRFLGFPRISFLPVIRDFRAFRQFPFYFQNKVLFASPANTLDVFHKKDIVFSAKSHRFHLRY
jgi:hypothetical protein